jgi:hypothetical protein
MIRTSPSQPSTHEDAIANVTDKGSLNTVLDDLLQRVWSRSLLSWKDGKRREKCQLHHGLLLREHTSSRLQDITINYSLNMHSSTHKQDLSYVQTPKRLFKKQTQDKQTKTLAIHSSFHIEIAVNPATNPTATAPQSHHTFFSFRNKLTVAGVSANTHISARSNHMPQPIFATSITAAVSEADAHADMGGGVLFPLINGANSTAAIVRPCIACVPRAKRGGAGGFSAMGLGCDGGGVEGMSTAMRSLPSASLFSAFFRNASTSSAAAEGSVRESWYALTA